jgi:hypothetical protein
MKTLCWSSNLVLASRDGCPASEYRLKDNQVEIRCAGKEDSEWRPLSRDELWRHFALNTPVAHWLRRRPA